MNRRKLFVAVGVVLASLGLALPTAQAKVQPLAPATDILAPLTEPIAPGVGAACGTATGGVALVAVLLASGTVPLPIVIDPNQLLILTSALAPACAAIPPAPTMKTYAQCEVDSAVADPAVPAPRTGAALFETAQATEDAIARITSVPGFDGLSEIFALLFQCKEPKPRTGSSPPGDEPLPTVAPPSSVPTFAPPSDIPAFDALPPTAALNAPTPAASRAHRALAASEIRTWRWGLWLEVVLMALAVGLVAGLGRRVVVDGWRRDPGTPS